MKVQVCTALVVVLAAVLVVEANPGMKFWLSFLRQVTSEVCGEDMCFPEGRECFKLMKPLNITEGTLESVRTNLTECAGDVDFSALELEDLTPKKDIHQHFLNFMEKFKVGDTTKQYALLKCFMERGGQLPTVLSCLREIRTDAATETK